MTNREFASNIIEKYDYAKELADAALSSLSKTEDLLKILNDSYTPDGYEWSFDDQSNWNMVKTIESVPDILIKDLVSEVPEIGVILEKLKMLFNDYCAALDTMDRDFTVDGHIWTSDGENNPYITLLQMEV
jgi:hypothetical protein